MDNLARTTTRLLPWSGADGKPCYLLSDGSGSGYLSRIADDIESVQLGMGNELLGHAQELIKDPKVGPAELRYLSARLTESLHDVLRVAESRGARLPAPDNCDAGRLLPARPTASPSTRPSSKPDVVSYRLAQTRARAGATAA